MKIQYWCKDGNNTQKKLLKTQPSHTSMNWEQN